jgi:hypothetical protein
MTQPLVLGATLLLLIAGCAAPGGGHHPATADSLFVNFYADRLILTEEDNILRRDSSARENRLDSLRRVYHFSQAEVETTTASLQKDPGDWKEFYDRVVRRLEHLQQKEPTVSHTPGHPL